MDHKRRILRKLRALIDTNKINESNWSDGEGWEVFEHLVSMRPGVYGTCAAWVCAVASEDYAMPELDAESVELLAMGWLGLTQEQWATLEGMPPQRAIEQLKSLTKHYEAPAACIAGGR